MRFNFGKNWKRFLKHINNEIIKTAETHLKEKLKLESLQGKTFLDVGCGSGLFSLAAMNLHASLVNSFDYDADSVECATHLKNMFYSNDDRWIIGRGDILDKKFISALGKRDIVYSWGVLHHTGQMWKALREVSELVAENGMLFISIYNDQGGISKRWSVIKYLFNKNIFIKIAISIIFISYWVIKNFVHDILLLKNPFKFYREYDHKRGMSYFIDCIDWLGGHPFEYAKPEEIFYFFQARGFVLEQLKTTQSWGCNEFVFKKNNHLCAE